MLKFVPPPDTRKRKSNSSRNDDEGIPEEQDENLNKVVSDSYSPETKASMAKMNEKDLSFELIEDLLRYIKGLNIPGAVLIFLPGWNLIFALLRHFQQHAVFGEN